MAGVNTVSPLTASPDSGNSAGTTKKTRGLDFKGFLKIIAAQMQNQSLSASSTDTSQYIMEMTLFSAIESMHTLTEQSSRQYASSLIGKDVSLSKFDEATGDQKVVTGTVSSVAYDPSTDDSLLEINGNFYDASNITNIFGDHVSAVESMATVGTETARETAASLIGKNVVLSVPDSGTGKNDSVTGTVEKVIFGASSGKILLQVNGKAYSISDVAEVFGQNQADSVPSGQDAGEKISV